MVWTKKLNACNAGYFEFPMSSVAEMNLSDDEGDIKLIGSESKVLVEPGLEGSKIVGHVRFENGVEVQSLVWIKKISCFMKSKH